MRYVGEYRGAGWSADVREVGSGWACEVMTARGPNATFACPVEPKEADAAQMAADFIESRLDGLTGEKPAKMAPVEPAPAAPAAEVPPAPDVEPFAPMTEERMTAEGAA